MKEVLEKKQKQKHTTNFSPFSFLLLLKSLGTIGRKMMNQKNTLILLALFLSISLSYAQEDFIASAPLSLNLIQCSTHDFDIIVQNTGDSRANFLIEQEGKPVKWNLFSPNLFTLAPGEYAVVKNRLEIPCDASGTYYLTTIISTDLQEKFVEQEINVLKPENIQFKSGKLEQTIDSCKKAQFSLELFNPANFTETYLLNIDKKIKDTKLSEDKLTLKGFETKNISVEVSPVDCELNGEFFLPLEIKTEKTKLTGVLDLKLIILPAKITKLEGPEKITINYGESQHQVKITNKLNKTEKYTLKLEGPNWFKLETSSLLINKDEIKTFNITANPLTTVTQGNYNLKLLIKDESNEEITKNFVFRLKKPISKQTIYKYLGFSVGGVVIVLFLIFVLRQVFSKSAREKRKKLRLSKEKIKKELEKELKLKYKLVPRSEIRRKRTRRFLGILGALLLMALFISVSVLSFHFRNYILLKQYYAWAFIFGFSLFLFLLTLITSIFTVFVSEEKKEQLAKEKELKEKERQRFEEWKQQELEKLESWKSEEENVLRSQIDKEYKDKYKLINKKDISHLTNLKTSFKWIYWLALFILILAAGFGAWHFKDILLNYKKHSIISLAVLIFLVIIHVINLNRKIVGKWPLINVRSKKTMNVGSKGLLQLLFSLNKNVENLKLRVSKTKKDVHVIPSKNVYQYFNVETNINEESFDKTSYSFKVNKAWLDANSVNKEDVKLVRFFDGKWNNIGSEIVSDDDSFVYYLANTSLIGQFAIIGKQKGSKENTSKSWFGYITIALLLVLSIGLITLIATTKEYQHLKGIPDQSWEKDTTLQLNLSPYFEDKDNDKLVFDLVEKPESIQAEIFDEVVVLTPKLGWTGSEYARFKANDLKGGETTSNRLRLDVKKSFVPKLIRKYVFQMLGALLLTVIIILIIVFRRPIIRFLEED